MKHLVVFMVCLSFALLSACTAESSTPTLEDGSETTAPILLVSGGEISKSFTRADLETLPVTEATFKDVPYKGVAVTALIQAAGFDPAQVKAIKAVAVDGFTVNYDPNQVLVEGVIVAYARADGDLAEEDGDFRMVLPGAEGKLNPRMLVELQVIQ
ncbi:MAG: molybdopterin-dependent oxidoreductase [Anaerolineales bacterium]|jgi:hypothetical protein|nr:molybdopterin-dependent oxidoreductase [Anaerolineales bacterium]